MEPCLSKADHSFDYADYGRKDGKCIYDGLRKAEENRRQVVLKAAKRLQGHPADTAAYLDGLEKGMRMAGASDATAKRLRYEVSAIITSYSLASTNERSGGKETSTSDGVPHEYMAAKTLEAQRSWPELVNTAREIRNTANNHERLQQGMPPRMGQGNHTARKFQDSKFDKLREQLIERTAKNQALDLLDAAIIAVANAFSTIASADIEALRDAEKRIHDKVNARFPRNVTLLKVEKQPLTLRP